MNDQTRAAFNVAACPAGTAVSAGAQLQAARKAAGLTLDDLSSMLKVSVKKLEALEANRQDLLPDVVFARALAASVCRILKIDTAPVLAQLPVASGMPVVPKAGHDAPTGHHGGWFAFTAQLPKPVLAGLLVLVLGIVTMLLWPHPDAVDVDRVATDDVPNAVDLYEPGVARSVRGNPEDVLVDPAQTPAPILAPDIASGTAAILTPASTSASIKVQTPVNAASPSLQATSVATGPLVKNTSVLGLRTSGPSWVEVTDAQGVTLLRRIVAEGERIDLSGVLPLSVVIGRSDTVSVTVRGQPFDLTAWSNSTVARFQVK